MPPPAPSPSRLTIALVVVAAVAVCMIAAAVMAPTALGGLGPWPVLVVAFVVFAASLAALWVAQKKRDRTLR